MPVNQETVSPSGGCRIEVIGECSRLWYVIQQKFLNFNTMCEKH